VVHKSDTGGVVTGILSASDAETAFDTIFSRVKAFDSSADITGIIIERQEKRGLEILVGGRVDPTFGKIITVGMGGTLVELIGTFRYGCRPWECRYQCNDPGIAGISPDKGIPQ
jgi:acyl-CoA synthetase (NDP forming)